MSTESTRKIEEAASNWLARRDAGPWTPEDQDHFDQWLNESTAHQVAYLRLERTWEEALRLKALGPGVPTGQIPAPGQLTRTPFFGEASSDAPTVDERSRRRLRHRAVWAVAATVVVAVTLYFASDQVRGDRYRTPVGGISSLPLVDGSKVVLNTASKIRVSLTATERRIDLQQGEAFFEVAKDPHRPFVVTVADKRVIAVGTKFSVRREHDQVRVVVTEGIVRVETLGGSGPRDVEQLTAGTVAHTSDAGTLLQQKPLAEAEEQLSWRGGILVFRNQTLADAIAEFNRYTETPIVISDPRVAEMRIAGSFRSTNVEGFVRLLDQGYPIRVERRDQEILLLSQ